MLGTILGAVMVACFMFAVGSLCFIMSLDSIGDGILFTIIGLCGFVLGMCFYLLGFVVLLEYVLFNIL